MKATRLTLCVLLLIATAACSRQVTHSGAISPEKAGSHVGQTITVEGVVTEVHTARSGSATFIDMGGSYPNNAFTGVIFASAMATVGDVSDLAGKTVDINGEMRLYRGKPEIVIYSRSQIKTH
jgi:DNA/RNA endonuclease YhcR with UshA esterase domain